MARSRRCLVLGSCRQRYCRRLDAMVQPQTDDRRTRRLLFAGPEGSVTFIAYARGGSLTKMIRQRTIPSRNLLRTSKISPATATITSSSRMNGAIRIPENGQPIIAPIPNHIMPEAVFGPPRQSRKAVRPSEDVYIAKLDGRNATDA
jgi:hypothetical protein